MALYSHITELIGNTPLLRLDPAVHGLPGVQLFAKLESQNPFGSVKDRAAWAMLRPELEDVRARGQTLIEASSGNTAKALRMLGAVFGIPLRTVTNRIKVDEVRQLLELLDTEIIELPGLSECPDPTSGTDVYAEIAATTSAEPGRYRHLSQYTNLVNVQAHREQTGPEIQRDLASAGISRVDFLIGGLGTTGSTRGIAEYLRKDSPDLQTIGVVSRRGEVVPGIRSQREMWEVGLFEPDRYDQIAAISAERAFQGTVELATGYGILGGPTSGATYAAAVDALGQARPPTAESETVGVFVVCDRLEPYVSYMASRQPELFGRTTRNPPPTPAEIAAVPELEPAELRGLGERETLVIVDTRGAMAYRAGHIPGAVNFPDHRLEELFVYGTPFSRSTPVVFSCPTGDLSRGFAARARRTGHRAFSVAGGVAGWRAAGLPLESDRGAVRRSD